MNRNPNKPRLLRDEDRSKDVAYTAESFSDMTDDRCVSSLTEMTVSEQAGVLFTDAKTREELLASLHGRRKS